MPEDAITRDATIQRFEFSWEAAWKCLQTHALEQGLEPGGPRQAIRHALTTGILPAPDAADVWLRMLEDRNRTTYIYDEDAAKAIYAHVRDEYLAALQTMIARLSEARET